MHDAAELYRIAVMTHHPKRRRSIMQQPHHRRMAAFAVALMVLALMVYGYQFWWSE
jgi:hypothetical protein